MHICDSVGFLDAAPMLWLPLSLGVWRWESTQQTGAHHFRSIFQLCETWVSKFLFLPRVSQLM